ncbi:MAG: (Fe-S)-binding protein [Nitrososphaerota archaeon]
MYRCALQTVDVIIALRSELVRLGYLDPEHKKAADMVLSFGNPYSKLLRKSVALPKGGETILFVGCSYAQYFPERVAKMGEVVSRLGNVGWLGPDEPCCGNILLVSGQVEKFIDYGKLVIKRLREAGVKRIITPCPGCHETLSKEYPKFFDFDFEVEHITQVLARSVETGKLSPRRLSAYVTFHDPCHLARYSRIVDEPRSIIGNAAGAILVEMKHNKLKTLCCGGGGGVPLSHPGLAAKIADRRLEEALTTGASLVITSCPMCELMLEGSARRKKADIKVADIIELF